MYNFLSALVKLFWGNFYILGVFYEKIFSFLLVIISICSLLLYGCSSNEQNSRQSEKLSIVTSIFPYYDFARNIVGNKADVKLLLSPGNEPHHYEPSPSDIVAIEECDIFIYNGGESDEWVENVLDSLENKNITVLKMTDYVSLLNEKILTILTVMRQMNIYGLLSEMPSSL